MQMVIDEPNICNQTGRVYFCINGNESSVCHVRLYNTPHSDDGIIALFEEKTTLYLGSDGLVNRLYVIRRYFSKRLVFHSRHLSEGNRPEKQKPAGTDMQGGMKDEGILHSKRLHGLCKRNIHPVCFGG